MGKFKNIVGIVIACLMVATVVYAVSGRFNTSQTAAVVLTKSAAKVDAKQTLRDSIVDYGMTFLGTPYVTAGCSENGFDCSGFVYFVYNHFDVKVPRSSIDYKDFGTEVPIDQVQKGDVLLFKSPTRDVIGHIGIVSNAQGKNSDFMHATSGRDMKVVVTNLEKTGYKKRFVKAVRVL